MTLILEKTKKCVLTFTLGLSVSMNLSANDNLPQKADFSKMQAYIGANIINPSKGTVTANSTLLVNQGRIEKVQASTGTIPDGYTIVDTKGKWVMPGLIDGHIHLAQSGSAFTRPDTFDARKISSYEDDQQWIKDNLSSILENYLKLGITSVIDMGGPSEYITGYRAVTHSGVYPDIYAAGALLSPFDVPILDVHGEMFTKVETSQDTVAMVKKQLPLKTELVKFVWSDETGLSMDELTALYKPAMSLAKAHNKRVAVHAESLIDAKMAIKAGADILVHGVMRDPIDDEFIQLMKSHNVTYMPTLTANIHYTEIFKNELTFTTFEHKHGHKEVISSFEILMENVEKTGQMFQMLLKYVPKVDQSDAEIAKLTEKEQSLVKQLRNYFSSEKERVQKDNLKQMINSGVNVAFGTDAGNPGTLHAASLYGEFLAWQQAGVSNQEILKAVTFGNAKALKLENKIGTLSAGQHANFVVLNENPYETLATITDPVMTVKQGHIVKPSNGVNHVKK